MQLLALTLRKISIRYWIGALMVPALLAALIFGSPITQVFSIIAFALYLFSTEILPVDMTALSIMILVIVSGLVTTEQGLSGFSSAATLTVLSMFILSAGVERTGLINRLGKFLFKISGSSLIRQILVIAFIIGPISGLLNNTAAVAIFLPLVIQLAEQSKTPVTKLLIPLSFISMLGGTLTLLGTSTNILANESFAQLGFEPIGVFDFTHIGAILLAVGTVYFITIGHLLLPVRKQDGADESGIPNMFLASIQVHEQSPFLGKTLDDIDFEHKFDLKLVKIVRNGRSHVKGAQSMPILANDIFIVYGQEQKIIAFDNHDHARLLVDFDNPHRRVTNGKIVKILIKAPYALEEKTLAEVRFWDKHFVSIIGVHREKLRKTHISDIKIQQGEILLGKVSDTNLRRLRKSKDFIVLEEIQDQYDKEKIWYALSIILGVVLLAAFQVVPIVVAALIGVFMMFLTRCLSPSEVYDAVNWDIIFLLAGVIPLGIAMQQSGGAQLIANFLVGLSDTLSPLMLLAAIYIVTTLLTEIISNNAAVVLLIPIAVTTAIELGMNPLAFVLIVMFAASTSFLSPVGYQTNTMVYASGNYKFSDFVVVGAPLNIILMFVTTMLIYYWVGI